MTLVVDPWALVSYARQVGRAAEDVDLIKSYFDSYAVAGTGGELFSIAREGHTHAVEVVEMSRGVLKGEMSLRNAADSDAYRRELGTAFDEFWIEYQAMTGEERDELAALGQRQLDEAREGA